MVSVAVVMVVAFAAGFAAALAVVGAAAWVTAVGWTGALPQGA